MGCGASKNVNEKPQDNQNTEKKESETTVTPIEGIDNFSINSDTTKEKSLQTPKIDKTNSEFITILNTETETESDNMKFTQIFKRKHNKNELPSNIPTSNENKIASSSPPENSDNLSPNHGMPKKQFDKSTSSIQIDNNVDFTVIKVDNTKNKIENIKVTESSSKKEKKKNKIIDDLEILNVDDVEQTEENILLAQKPLGYKGDYYTMNQELINKTNYKNINKFEGITENDEDIENEDDEELNEPKVIKNSFFTEDDSTDQKKKKSSKFFRSNSKNKKNDIVVIKNSSLIDSQHNSENALECDFSDIPEHGKPLRSNNSMTNNDDNANIHPFSVC